MCVCVCVCALTRARVWLLWLLWLWRWLWLWLRLWLLLATLAVIRLHYEGDCNDTATGSQDTTLLCRGGQPVDNSTRRVLLDLVHRRSRRSRRRRRVYTPPGTPQSNARTSERQGYAKFHIDRQKHLWDGSPRVLRDAPGSPQSATRGHRNQSAIDRNRQQSPTWDTGKT